VASEHLEDRVQAHVLRIQDLASLQVGTAPGEMVGPDDARGDRCAVAMFSAVGPLGNAIAQ